MCDVVPVDLDAFPYIGWEDGILLLQDFWRSVAGSQSSAVGTAGLFPSPPKVCVRICLHL